MAEGWYRIVTYCNYVSGNGEVDVDLMSLLPDVKLFIGLEPDEELRESLRTRVQGMGRDIQVSKSFSTISRTNINISNKLEHVIKIRSLYRVHFSCGAFTCHHF